jgi:PX domain-containing protein kinase-like protein
VVCIAELALQHVSMTLRSEVNYEIVKPVPEIGWRLRKHYFLVKSRINPKEELLLSWVEHGPDKYLEDRDLQGVFKSISNLQVAIVAYFIVNMCIIFSLFLVILLR